MAFNPDILKKFTALKKNEKQIPYTVKEAGLKGDITEVEGAKLLTYSENFAISPSLPPAELFNNECECCLELLPGVRAKKAEKLKNVGIRRIKDALSHEKHKKHAHIKNSLFIILFFPMLFELQFYSVCSTMIF